jgi:uncharacterized protein YndB with AHSA1/START domain
MRPVTVSKHISAPRERVFDFVADLAARPAYSDHYLDDYRLARPNPIGEGASARFRLATPFLKKEYAELAVAEYDRPRRIVEEIRVGRLGRNRSLAVYEFMPEAGGLTHLELSLLSEPATPIDSVKQYLARGWIKRNAAKSLERLRMIFEERPGEPLRRVSIAGWEPAKAPRFGEPAGFDPSRPAPGEPAPGGGSAS